MSDIPITQPTLLLRIRDTEDEASWERFVKIYTPLVFGYCRKRGLQEADASDVAQEVMRTVAQSINRFDYNKKKGTFRGWLLTVTRNKLLKYFSKLQKQPIGTGRTTIQTKLEETPDAVETDHWNHAYQQRLFQWASG
ncbi:MAG: sigma-70 family RNA polymerase sigma factor, partial [Verrucomicrobia bacterium]|nr:sigma-70 family RNA polymerase sigma factor [Verrucomicrobiota bacterium]